MLFLFGISMWHFCSWVVWNKPFFSYLSVECGVVGELFFISLLGKGVKNNYMTSSILFYCHFVNDFIAGRLLKLVFNGKTSTQWGRSWMIYRWEEFMYRYYVCFYLYIFQLFSELALWNYFRRTLNFECTCFWWLIDFLKLEVGYFIELARGDVQGEQVSSFIQTAIFVIKVFRLWLSWVRLVFVR